MLSRFVWLPGIDTSAKVSLLERQLGVLMVGLPWLHLGPAGIITVV